VFALAGIAVGCSEDALFVMHEEYIQTGDNSRYMGGACEQLARGVSSATGAGGDDLPPYSLEMKADDDGVQVVLRNERDTGASIERHYSTAFLESGQRDKLQIRLDGDQIARIIVWGGKSCEQPRDSDEDAGR
jgi:hypothetical protein